MLNSWESFNEIRHTLRKLKSISADKDPNAAEEGYWQITICLSEATGREARIVKLTCKDCFDVKLDDLFDAMAIELKIEKIGDQQLEAGRFRIVDNEGSAIAFNCRQITIEQISSSL